MCKLPFWRQMSVNINLSPKGPKVLEGNVDSVEGNGGFSAWEEYVSWWEKQVWVQHFRKKGEVNCVNCLPVWPCILSLIFPPSRSQTSSSPDWLPDKTEFPSQIKHLQAWFRNNHLISPHEGGAVLPWPKEAQTTGSWTCWCLSFP